MSRRSTPERIDAARRAATRQRLIGERVNRGGSRYLDRGVGD